ncbi:MAG: HsdR family type I site-specific deoxyribonuclease [Actinomycetota bacterium]
MPTLPSGFPASEACQWADRRFQAWSRGPDRGGGLSPRSYSEDELVEQPSLELLRELGWTVVDANSETLGPEGTLGRDSIGETILTHRLLASLRKLNPGLPETVIAEAAAAVSKDRSLMDPVRASKEIYGLLRDGYPASWQDEQGDEKEARVLYVDFAEPANNDWLAASQVWITGDLHKRRPDTILFVNGIPLVLLEFKGATRPVREAYDDNLTDYRDTIPHLFWTNAFVILSNGSDAKVGATYAPWEMFGKWRYIDSDKSVGAVALETAIRGTCDKEKLLDILENFVAYIERPRGLVKSLARNHQALGVNDALAKLDEIRSTGEKRLGVFWHTQGSGKSLSMLWFTQKVLRKRPGNWSFVMVTDRKELDEQLHDEFADAGAISKEAKVHAQSAAHLRTLLQADNRYVFTLIHKFRLDETESAMPVLSDRDDVIVITDEAHRSQYDILAKNMREALPNAAFMGFTGTPLLVGEELTRREFGDYVSTYDFSEAIVDGATVPLYYENRIPELQIVNENFDEELTALVEDAELDDETEGQLVRRFGREYALITRAERLRTIAKDIVRHFTGRGFRGKGMYVGIDKATALRMHDMVKEEWDLYLAELRRQLNETPELERPWLQSQMEFMQSTDMALVVSQGQNEIADMKRLGLDIRPHRERMNNESLDLDFKDPDHPLRLVFVCAMWMTGFDAPSCSTIYLDRPMRNHTLMQTIARANRVFPDKENGLIVDYIGVFRDLERALAIYGAASGEIDSLIQQKDELVSALASAVEAVAEFCERYDIDLDDLREASGFAFIALRDSAVESLLVDNQLREEFMALARTARKLFKAVLPDPAATIHQPMVAVIRVIAERIADLVRPERQEIGELANAVDLLLDRSVGAEEYVIRAAAEGADPDPVIDLSKIDFEALSARFAGRKRAETERLAALIKRRAIGAATRNPTRHELVERIEALIAEYNEGSVNIDEYLRRLISLSGDLSAEERRAVEQDMTEEELALFDLLTKPDPTLDEAQRRQVKQSAKKLLVHLHEKLVMDWRRKANTFADIQVAIRNVLDEQLPPDPYPPAMFNAKVDLIFNHVLNAYGDDGSNVYITDEISPPVRFGAVSVPGTADEVLTNQVVERIRVDAEFAALIARELGGSAPVYTRTIEELIANDEDDRIEFKSTARWNLQEGKKDPRMEDAVVKTVAGFLNSDGGTLLIGIGPDRSAVGLDHDYALVKPPNGDGFVNWLTTRLINALGEAAVARTNARVVVYQEKEICRVNAPSASTPAWVSTAKGTRVLYARMNNSTRAIPEEEIPLYLASRGLSAVSPLPQEAQAELVPFEMVEPTDAERNTTCVPLVGLRAAAGAFGETQEVEPLGWVTFETTHPFKKGMFVGKVLGRSMMPLIPDPSYCLFRGPVQGTRQGKILLVQHHAISDPENGGSYTVKRFFSTKEEFDGSWRHVEIRLESINPEFDPIVLHDVPDDEFKVIAEMVQVLA